MGNHFDRYPPNDGAVRGSRREYRELTTFVRDNGNAVDRIGDETGTHLAVMRDGKPSSFEDRSLPVSSLEKPYYSYRFVHTWPPGTEKWTIEISDIDRAFGRDGGAQQVHIKDHRRREVRIAKLLDRGVIVPAGDAR
ncbi:glycohydrolase toxin TNT-related protein [Leifsonia xyli]|uniref:glycohydrolase toxin TNT-related protein n=1 Tax=Leifsonia xyli TaxID=1575 RepID=UPI003D6658EB